MNEYKIYQVRDDFRLEYGFCGWQQILRTHPGLKGLPREAWELVYTYRTEKEPSLDWLYICFNRSMGNKRHPTPDDFTGRSMSVSDIVETPDGKLWLCDSFGWREVQWDEEAEA